MRVLLAEIALLFLQIKVSTSSNSTAEKEAASRNESDIEVGDKSGSDQGIILGDAPSDNQAKDTSIASVEELKNLAGGADIKVYCCCIYF